MRATRIAKFAVLAIVAVAVFGFIVMSLWNWILPPVTGWHPITYWQALGLLGLSWLLFGGPRTWFGGGHRGHWQHRVRARWESMTPEERERFRHGMARRCGHEAATAPESKA